LDTGEDESRKGFLNFTPQKSIDKSTLLATTIPPYKGFRGFGLYILGSKVLVVMVSGPWLLVPGYKLLSLGN
jgi:hypothetical protein